MQIDRTGTFRCQATEWAVSKSSGGYPQLVARLYMIEYYDQQEKEWVDFSEFQMEITAYWILYGRVKGTDNRGPTLNCQQVMKVFGWDGKSFATLAAGDYTDLLFQVRIDENTYPEAKTPYQVGWLDVSDADPNRQLKKLNVEELKGLDVEFAGLLKPTPKAVSAAKAPPKMPSKVTAPPVVGSDKEIVTVTGVVNQSMAEETPPETAEQRKAKMAAKSARLRAEAKKKPTLPVPPMHPPVTGQINSDCTKQLAWEAIVELRDPEKTDEELRTSWTAAINEIAGPGVSDEKITGNQWNDIKDKVLGEVGLF